MCGTCARLCSRRPPKVHRHASSRTPTGRLGATSPGCGDGELVLTVADVQAASLCAASPSMKKRYASMALRSTRRPRQVPDGDQWRAALGRAVAAARPPQPRAAGRAGLLAREVAALKEEEAVCDAPDDGRRASEDWWRTAIIDMATGVIRRAAVQGAGRPARAAQMPAVDHGPLAPSIAIARMAATCGVGLNSAMTSAVNVLGDVHVRRS